MPPSIAAYATPARLLHGADAVERHACAADERAPRLEDQRHAVRHSLDERSDERRRPRAAARRGCGGRRGRRRGRGRLRRPLQALEEGEDALEREHAFVRPAELRPDVDVHALDLEPELARALDLPLGRVGAEAELRLRMRRLDRAVRHGFDARREPHEHASHTHRCRRVRFARSVEHDERAGLGGRAQLLLRLVVSVEDKPLAGQPRGARERKLTERGDVGTDALLGEQSQQRDVGERLRPVSDQRARAPPPGTPAPARGACARSRRGAASRTPPRAAVARTPPSAARRPRSARSRERARARC